MDAKPVSFLLATALHAPLLYGAYTGVNTHTVEEKTIVIDIVSMAAPAAKPQNSPTRQHKKKHIKRPRHKTQKTRTVSTSPSPAPLVLKAVKPHYPREARFKGLEGTVEIRTNITRQGQPLNVTVAQSCGHRLLDHAAVIAVQKWQFRKQSSQTDVIVPIKFQLKP